MTTEREIDTIMLCHCGSSEDPHNYRHRFEPTITIDKWENDGGDFYKMDAEDFKGITVEGKCSFPQCNAVKNLHGPIIKHEYVPSNVFIKRKILFALPLDTLCRVCKEDLDSHSSMTHAFTTKVVIENKTKHDSVKIRGKTYDQTIILEEDLVDES